MTSIFIGDLLSLASPTNLINIVKGGPVVIFLLMFVITSYLYSKMGDKDIRTIAFLGLFYTISLAVCAAAYFAANATDKLLTDAQVKQQYLAVADKLDQLPRQERFASSLGLSDWYVVFRARLGVRQALRDVCKNKSTECRPDNGIQHYTLIMNKSSPQIISNTLAVDLFRFNNAAYYVEWQDGDVPTNGEVSWAMKNTQLLIDQIEKCKNDSAVN